MPTIKDYDYEAPEVPYEEISKPRPRASQDVAAAKRARQPEEAPIALPTRDPRQLLLGAVGVLAVIGVLVLAIAQPGPAAPLAITPMPTEAPATAAPTASPAPTTAPEPTIAATESPAPTEAALEAPVEPPQTGRGLTLPEEEPAVERAPEAAPAEAAPSYVENVGAQAPHCIRTCDGQPGPNGGDWVAVPTGEPQYLNNVGAQAPHKVR